MRQFVLGQLMRQFVPYNPVRAFLPPSYWGRRSMYFSHAVDFNTLAASAVAQTERFNQEISSDFLCLSLSCVCTTLADGATEQSFLEFTAQISAASGGSFWGANYQHAGNLFGRMSVDGAGPKHLEYGQLVPGGETITVSLNNLEAFARRIWITFHGVKIFRDVWE